MKKRCRRRLEIAGIFSALIMLSATPIMAQVSNLVFNFGTDVRRQNLSGNMTGSEPGFTSAGTLDLGALPVASSNNAPVAENDAVTTAENTAVAITLSATDADDDMLTYSTSTPANGTLSGTAPNLTYTPTADFSGVDSFTFTANDGTAASNTATVTITVSGVPIPELAAWEANMIQFGHYHGQQIVDLQDDVDINPPLARTYYDAARVHYQIADYIGDPYFLTYAQAAVHVYRDRYVLPNDGGVPGYWKFTEGLRMDFDRTGHPASQDAVVRLSNRAWAQDTQPLEWSESEGLSREIAYATMAHLDARALGEPPRSRLEDMIDQMIGPGGHFDQWFEGEMVENFAPFMFGLSAEALMRYYEEVQNDPRILPALRTGADFIWEHAWDPVHEAFYYRYDNQLLGAGSADLNLLIAPVYAWLYHYTGNPVYRDRGDQVFAGGVKKAWLSGYKQFNQNYRSSFEYVRLRQLPLRYLVPSANAGADRTITDADGSVSEPVTLDAGNSIGAITSYVWMVNGAAVVTGVHATVSFDLGIHEITLVVEDGEGQTDMDTVTITVIADLPPVADAGKDLFVLNGARVMLDGSESIDPNGDPIAYAWTQTAGPVVELDNASTSSPAFTAPTNASLRFQVTVSANGLSSRDTVNVTSTQSPPVPSRGLIHEWLFEGSGNSVINSMNSGFSGAFPPEPNAPARVEGHVGGALSFDGTDDRVDIPSFDLTGDTFTLSLWMNLRAQPNDGRLFSKASGESVDEHILMLSTYNQEQRLRFRIKTDATGNTATVLTPVDVFVFNTWHHVAVVYNGTTLRIWVDGTEAASLAISGVITQSPDGVALGNQPLGAGNRPLDGLLDQVRIYSRALTEEELTRLRNETAVTLLTFSNWMRIYNPALTGDDALPDADPDGNGIPNLLNTRWMLIPPHPWRA